ncbi:MAG: hypothetical protein B6226_04750 [Candidatus Cloacimonetes bacterium 4572_65]|nr:MAG: hypothetical protein B6226_04750 [Candidatus Cloacimonetes bacterium 4572_65]
MNVMLLFLLGIITGTIFKKREKLFTLSGYITTISLYLMLLFLGLSIGFNKSIMDNMAQLGLTSFLFAIVSIIGSIIAILPLYLVFKKR